jgi:hypothetical protein
MRLTCLSYRNHDRDDNLATVAFGAAKKFGNNPFIALLDGAWRDWLECEPD